MIPRVRGLRCGRLVSRGRGRHISRVIDTWELIFVLSSKLGMFCGNESFLLEAGDALLLPPGVRHGGTAEYARDLSFYWIHFLPGDGAEEAALKAFPRVARLENFTRLSEYFQLYQSLWRDPRPDAEAVDCVAGLILHEVRRERERPGGGAECGAEPALLRKLERILVLRYREPLTTSLLAAELGCSADYLGHLFRKFRGHGIIEELHNQRIRHAQALLQGSPLTVSQILYEVGYNDPIWFRRQFFRRLAMTPHEFRRLKNSENINTE